MPVNLPAFGVPTPYQGTISAVGSAALRKPQEGFKYVPIQIAWGLYNPQQSILVNLQSQITTTVLSQIACLYVDNTSCSHAIHILFVDTGFVLTVAALSAGYYPVITNQTQFFAYADNHEVSAADLTNIFVMNYSMPGDQWSKNTLGVPYYVSGANGAVQAQAQGNFTVVENAPLQTSTTYDLSGAAPSPLANILVDYKLIFFFNASPPAGATTQIAFGMQGVQILEEFNIPYGSLSYDPVVPLTQVNGLCLSGASGTGTLGGHITLQVTYSGPTVNQFGTIYCAVNYSQQ